jgi:phospholipid transport system substrate-binding protein
MMPPPEMQHAYLEQPADLVRQGIDELIAFMGQRPRPTGMKVAAFLEQNVAPAFDFDYMARMAMGPAYMYLSEAQRSDLQQKIAEDFLGVLSRRLAGFSSQRVRYFRAHRGYRGEVTVTVGIANAEGYPARLDFRLYNSGDGWKIYDVAANGRSAVSFYRRKFAAMRMQPPVRYHG